MSVKPKVDHEFVSHQHANVHGAKANKTFPVTGKKHEDC